MSEYLTARLYVPGTVSLKDFSRIVDEFLAAGFAPEASPGVGCLYWAYEGWHGLSPIEEAFESFVESPSWGLQMWWTNGSSEPIPVRLVATPPLGERHFRPGNYLSLHEDPITVVSISVDWLEDQLLPLEEFVSWEMRLATLVRPQYGNAGGEGGLFGADPSRPDLSAIIAAEPQPLDWWNLFGPSFVDRIGRSRLLSAPAWRITELGADTIIIRLSPTPADVSQEMAAAVAEHLGVPLVQSAS